MSFINYKHFNEKEYEQEKNINYKHCNFQEDYEEPKMMYRPLETVFDATMDREGKTLTAYTSGKTFQAFMRREDDGNTTEDRIKIFYGVDAPINQGMIVAYGTKKYILINRETEENTCYYKSYGIACNAVITLNDGSIVGVPAYASDMQRPLEYSGSVLTVIQGYIEFICESNAQTRNFKVNDRFNSFGRTYKVTNTYHKDGMVHLVSEVALESEEDKPPTKMVISDINSVQKYQVGDSVGMVITLYQGDKEVEGTLRYDSSDLNVATIDSRGTVEFVGVGTVTFSAYWVEMNEYAKITVTCDTEQLIYKHTVSVTYSGLNPTIKIGGSFKKFTAHIFIDNEEVEPDKGEWEITCSISGVEKILTTRGEEYYGQPNAIGIKLADDSDFIGETLTVKWTYKGASHSVDCPISGL